MNGIGNVIAKYRKERGLSQSGLAERMQKYGFSPSAASVSSWEKDVSVPNALQFIAICQELGIVDVAGTFFDNGYSSDVLSGLNDEGKKRVREYVSLLKLSGEFSDKQTVISVAEISKAAPTNRSRLIRTGETGNEEVYGKKKPQDITKKQEPSKIQDITKVYRLYNLPASAGLGEFLDGEDYTEIAATPDIPAATDFGIRIKGNSMEPRFRNGDVVWVKKCNSLNDGEIGIFFLDGNAYCKKLKKDKTGVALVSINPDYSPIIITEDSNLITFGKVLS